MAGTLDVLEQARVRLNVLPRGALGAPSEQGGLSPEQAAAIDEVDQAVTGWLAASPDNAGKLLTDPVGALSEALGEAPPPAEVIGLMTSEQDEPAALFTAAGSAVGFATQPLPPPVETPQPVAASQKTSNAANDVTFTLSLGALSRALQAQVGTKIEEFLGAPLPLTVPGAVMGLEMAPRSTTPTLTMAGGEVRLSMRFGARLHVDNTPVQLDDIVMTVPIEVEATSPAPGLALSITPDGNAAEFGSPADGGDGGSASLVDDLLPGLDEAENQLDGASPVDVRKAVETLLVTELVEGLLPLSLDVPEVAVVCSLEPRALGAGFVEGDGGHEDGLAIGVNYGARDGQAEAVEVPATSSVPRGLESHLELSNGLLLRIVCCLVPKTFAGLPDQPTTSTASSCRWEGGTVHDPDGESWKLGHIEVTCTDSIVLDARLTKSGFGWKATVTLNMKIEVGQGSRLLRVEPEIDVDVDLEWWARIGIVAIGAIVGALAGALTGGIAGALVGLGIVLLVEMLFDLLDPLNAPSVLSGALEDPLRLVPPAITDVFGEPLVEDATWDDLETVGLVVGAGEPPVVASGVDLVVGTGDGIDLDTGQVVDRTLVPEMMNVDLVHERGQVVALAAAAPVESVIGPDAAAPAGGVPSGTATPRLRSLPIVRPFDVMTDAGPHFRAAGTARLVSLPGLSPDEILFSDVREMAFPDQPTAQADPSAVGEPDSGAARPFVVRTTSGNFARCLLWRDRSGAVRLRFRTWEVRPPAVEFDVRVKNTTQGKFGVSRVLSGLELTASAQPSPVGWPEAVGNATVKWFVDGDPKTGHAALADGVTVDVTGDTARVQVGTGFDFEGTLAAVVEASDGTAFTVTRHVVNIGVVDPGPDRPGGGPLRPGGSPGDPFGPGGGPFGGGRPGGPGGPGGPHVPV